MSVIVIDSFARSKKSAQFKIGNMIAGFRDEVEIEGEILYISGNNALLKTPHGNVTVSLIGARWL
jgi:hypothetical protein